MCGWDGFPSQGKRRDKLQASEGEKTMLMIWTDGGCYPNPGPGGWGFVRSDSFESFGGAARTTNNQMEMTAIIEAMKSVPDGGEVTIFADSQYCINGLTIWKAGWVRKNWMKKGEPMPNRQHWLDLHFQQQRIKSNFKWVRGHSGNAGNERADKLATMGRITMA